MNAIASPKPTVSVIRALVAFSAAVGLVLAAGAVQVRAASLETTSPVPTSVKASYKIYKAGILLGSVEEQFVRDGDRYRITSATRAEGPLSAFIREEISVTSEGKIGPTGLVPTLFSTTRKTDTGKSFTTKFNWDKLELVREHEDRDAPGGVAKEIFGLPVGTQDRLSAMYQFMVARPVADTVSALMTQGKNAERYQYVKQGEPSVSTRAGQFATVHYSREAKAGEAKAELWLAKDRSFIPVRMIFTDPKGTSLEQSLVGLVIQ